MSELKTVFDSFGPEYLETFKDTMPTHQRKVLDAILKCRTLKCGVTKFHCDDCDTSHEYMRSCGNRHCPLCQYGKTQVWLAKQLERRLPTHYFMVTFTVPQQIRRFMRSHQKDCYDAMFRASSQTLRKFLADPRYVGGESPGFFGVLHTWGSQLQHHPHIHYVVPGGALNKSKTCWLSSSPDYLANYQNMAKVFRGIYRELMEKKGLLKEIPASVWQKGWNVNLAAVGDAENTLHYLAGYVFRVAISNHRILKIENGRVYFWFKSRDSKKRKLMSLTGMEFLRRFLQHALPTGFKKIRYYGFYAGPSRTDWEHIRGLIELSQGFERERFEIQELPAPKRPVCRHCGTPLRHVITLVPWQGRLISINSTKRKRSTVPI